MKVAQNIFAILWRDLGNRGRGCLRPSSKCDYERKRQQRAQVTPGSGNLHRVPHQSGLSQLQYTVRIDPVERAKDASGASSVKPCSSVPPITSVPLRPAPGKSRSRHDAEKHRVRFTVTSVRRMANTPKLAHLLAGTTRKSLIRFLVSARCEAHISCRMKAK